MKKGTVIRTDGDGMESHLSPNSDILSSLIGQISVDIPAGEVMEGSSHGARQPIHSLRQKLDASSVSRKRVEEPRFVPFEPFKGATKPVFPSSPTQITMPEVHKENSTKPQNKLCQCRPVKQRRSSLRCRRDSRDYLCREQDVRNLADSEVEKLEEKFQAMQRKAELLETKLKCQVQVNADLKRLLVAAVGEDIQARVEFLTEDKLKLGSDVQKYTDRLTADQETKERLEVQAEIWKSKFLSCGLLVDNLMKHNKAQVEKYQELKDASVLLLDENKAVLQKLRFLSSHLSRMADFQMDATCPDAANVNSPNLNKLAVLNETRSLLTACGDLKFDQTVSCESPASWNRNESSAEWTLRQVLEKHGQTANQGHTDFELLRRALINQPEFLTPPWKCCSKCSGLVQDV